MTIRCIAIRAILLPLVLCGRPAEAASVTYGSVELGLNPPAIAAILMFSSPPTSARGSWDTLNNSDILSFQITTRFFAPAGFYTASITQDVQSSTGAKLDGGQISGTLGGVRGTTTTGSRPFADDFESNRGRFANGYRELASSSSVRMVHSWPGSVAAPSTASTPVSVSLPLLVPVQHGSSFAPATSSSSSAAAVLTGAAVPEPSSLVLAGTAALLGLGAWSVRCVRRSGASPQY